jgi:hypothetical protein
MEVKLTLAEINSALTRNGYSAYKCTSAEYVDDKASGWFLFRVTFTARRHRFNTRLFFDNTNKIAWPVHANNCRRLHSSNR